MTPKELVDGLNEKFDDYVFRYIGILMNSEAYFPTPFGGADLSEGLGYMKLQCYNGEKYISLKRKLLLTNCTWTRIKGTEDMSIDGKGMIGVAKTGKFTKASLEYAQKLTVEELEKEFVE